MSIYYQDDHVTLYHGDCRDITDWLTADVLITDPPYGMSFRSNWRDEKFAPIAGDGDTSVRDQALDLWGVTKPAAVFGTWRIPRPSSTTQLLVWHKRGRGPGMGDLSTAFGTSHEDIYLIGKWDKQGKRRESVITTTGSPSAEATRVGHPTPKPVGLIESLIDCAIPGTVADPFAGGGSTLVAARNLGRHAIGVELEESYCEIIARRLDQGCLDLEGA